MINAGIKEGINERRHERRFNLVAAARPYFGVLLVAVLIVAIAGGLSVGRIPSGIYPEVAFPRIVIVASVPGLGIKSVEVSVTRALEDAVSVVLGVTRVRSKTVRGAAELAIDFAPQTEMVQALNDVRARVAEINAALPPQTQMIVERQTPSVFPIISVVVTGHRPLDELRDYAVFDLKPRISRLPDVSYVTVQGGDTREILVEADPLALAQAHLSLDDLSAALAKQQRLRAIGRLDRGQLQYQVLGDTLVQHPLDLESIVVADRTPQPIRVADVARVLVWHEDRTVAVSSFGADAVTLTVFRRHGGDAITVSRGIEQILGEAKASAPSGMHIATVYDQANLVRTSIRNVRDAILIGGLFGVLTLLLFLKSGRATLIATLSIPITLLMTFVVLRWTGDTLNLMSLGGIAIAIGILIDDTVVVIENITRHLQKGDTADRAVMAASREITGAVIGATLTTVLVFVPLMFLSGVIGQFFQSLCLALGIAVMLSLLVSLTIMPMLAARFLGGRPMPAPGRVYGAFAALYETALRRVLAWPRASLLACVLMVVPGWLLFERLATGFMPEMDEGAFVLDYYMPVGTSLAETDRVLRKVETILRGTKDVQSSLRRTGAELGFFATESYTGDVLISLAATRSRAMHEVISELRDRIADEVPELSVEFVPLVADQINDLSGVSAPVEVKVFGPDYQVLREIAGQVASALETIDGVVDVDAHVRAGNPDLIVSTDALAAQRAHLTAQDVENQVHAALYGNVAFTLPEADRLTNVRVRYPDDVRFDRLLLGDLPLMTPSGAAVPLRQIARLTEQRSLNELWRENQQPMINVTAEIEHRDLGSIVRDVRAALASIDVQGGYRTEIAGSYESQQQAFANLLMVLLTGAALVYLLLAVQFQSLVLPLLIFLTQPLSLTAALFALWITHTPLNVSSFMGAILLIGLDVKNGILLIEQVRQLRAAGAPLQTALIDAGRTRFRPILMTSLTAVLGLLPLALGIGPGAQMQQPLAIAVIGGLVANMLFTRLVIPVGYLVLTRESQDVAQSPAPGSAPSS